MSLLKHQPESADFPGFPATQRAPRSPLERLLREVGPEVDELLRRFRVHPDEAEALLAETLQTLVWKWETVRDRPAWLLAVLERRCAARHPERDRR